MQTISQLAQKHKTDKFEHEYCPIYEQFLNPIRKKVKNVLEIGVAWGCSLRLWEEVFPNAQIYGIDHNQGNLFQTDRIHTICADQSDRKSLENLVWAFEKDFDLIIDDGSHQIKDQLLSLGILFPILRKDGFYIIEDLVTFSNKVFYRKSGVNPSDSELENSTFEVLKAFKEDGKIRTPYIEDDEIQFLERQSECVWLGECFDPNSILGILKKG